VLRRLVGVDRRRFLGRPPTQLQPSRRGHKARDRPLKRRLVLVSLALLLLLTPAAHAQTPLQELRDLIDARLALMWQTLLIRQTLHYASYGRYFQGLRTHVITPADGLESFPDNAGSRPTDQIANWHDFLETDLPALLPMMIVINVYEAPAGQGFQACVYVYAAGTLYNRCKAIGPEAVERTISWHAVQLP
jgi:hypothetical protein